MNESNILLPILCEYCNVHIRASDFIAHTTFCSENYEDYYNDENDENDENDLDRYITSSRQISGANLRIFLSDHYDITGISTSISRSRSRTPSVASSLTRNSPISNSLTRITPISSSRTRNSRSTINSPAASSYEQNLRLSERIGKVEKGVVNINNISVILTSNEIPDETLCVICQEDLKNNARMLKCSHLYCNNCIYEWLKKTKTCPLCKIELE